MVIFVIWSGVITMNFNPINLIYNILSFISAGYIVAIGIIMWESTHDISTTFFAGVLVFIPMALGIATAVFHKGMDEMEGK